MKIISVVKDGRRYDLTQSELIDTLNKGGPGSGRFSDEAKGVKLHVARHLRRQGILNRMKKGGPGSGRYPKGSGKQFNEGDIGPADKPDFFNLSGSQREDYLIERSQGKSHQDAFKFAENMPIRLRR